MIKINNKSGFTAVELLVTLFIAAAFLLSGYQLYSLIIKDGGQTRSQTRASNVAYDYLQRYKSTATNPCIAQTPVNNQSITAANLSNVTVTVAITCPYGVSSSISKVQVTLGYNNPQLFIINATYVGNSANKGAIVNGRILELDAGDINSYPGSGTSWLDLSGNANNGTLMNSVGYSSNNGGALVFDGINDYVSKASSVNAGNNFSVFAWVKSQPATSGRNVVVSNSYPFTASQGFLLCFQLDNRFFLSVGSDTAYAQSNAGLITDGAWNYIGATVINGGASFNLYFNGYATAIQSQVLVSSNISYSNNTFYIGNRSAEYYKGQIGEVSIYNRVLSPDEVKQNFDAFSGRYGL